MRRETEISKKLNRQLRRNRKIDNINRSGEIDEIDEI